MIWSTVFLFAASHIFVDARTNQPLKVCSLSFSVCLNLIMLVGVPTSIFTQSFPFKTLVLVLRVWFIWYIADWKDLHLFGHRLANGWASEEISRISRVSKNLHYLLALVISHCRQILQVFTELIWLMSLETCPLQEEGCLFCGRGIWY